MTDFQVSASPTGMLHLQAGGTRAHLCNAHNAGFYGRLVSDRDISRYPLNRCCKRCASATRWQSIIAEATERFSCISA